MPETAAGDAKVTADMDRAEKIGLYFNFRHQNSSGSVFAWILAGIFLFFFITPLTASGEISLPDSEKKELYRQGAESFRRATEISGADPAAARELYGKAILRFERLVAEGDVRNGKLFYNIGNIYFLLDDIGRAILNYRRAEQYIPNDPNLAKNLTYARSVRRDTMAIKDKEKILQTLFFFHYDLATQTRLLLFGIFYISFWVFAAIKVFSKRPFTSWSLGISLFFTLLFGLSLYVEKRQSMTNLEGVILAGEVIGRQGDAESYQPSFADPVHAGTEFKLLEDRGAWWLIELPDGRSTWIPQQSGELVRR
ncbi:MAG: tetratricopeptide repeat protein [Desulfobulbales bacterium]|nr:tetratricopeptide repeat protein [Desulfobulbales bacterium]